MEAAFADEQARKTPHELLELLSRIFSEFDALADAHGLPGAIHCTEATAMLLRGEFQLQPRGAVEIKGEGEMHRFLLAAAEPIPGG